MISNQQQSTAINSNQQQPTATNKGCDISIISTL
jgi:hypothetical protein